MVVCDFGCGSGGWVIPLAKELKTGMVYAVDILDDVISALNGKISSQQISNVKTMVGDIERGIRIKDDYFDLVLITNLLFQSDNKEAILKEASRVLKSGGQILMVDWKLDAPIGSREGRISATDAKMMAEKIGLKVETEFSAGNFHWGIILRKI